MIAKASCTYELSKYKLRGISLVLGYVGKLCFVECAQASPNSSTPAQLARFVARRHYRKHHQLDEGVRPLESAARSQIPYARTSVCLVVRFQPIGRNRNRAPKAKPERPGANLLLRTRSIHMQLPRCFYLVQAFEPGACR